MWESIGSAIEFNGDGVRMRSIKVGVDDNYVIATEPSVEAVNNKSFIRMQSVMAPLCSYRINLLFM